MTNRRYLSVVAAAATLLAAAPLSSIFDRWTWLIQCFLAVALVAGAATLARTLRAPVWGQAGAGAVALLFALTWMFPSHSELIGIIPTPGTFDYFGQLLRQSVTDIRELGVPVPDGDPLLFITVLGVGFVAICVDLLTVALRRPALAGLPMLAVYSVPVAVYTDSVPVLPFMVGACGFIWLLVSDNVDRVRRFGRRFTGDGRDVDSWEPSPLAAAGRRLAVVGVVLAVALPLAVPGMTTGLIDRFGTGGGDGTGPGRGRGSSVDLFANLSGQLKQDEEEELVRVRTDDPDPYYLRFGVADRITTEGFAARRPSGQPASRGLPDDVPDTAGVTERRYHATVEVTGLDQSLLPVYLQPVNLDGVDANWYYDERMQVVYSNRDRSKDKEYSFDYVRSYYSPAALERAKPLDADDDIQRRYTFVPPVREIREQVAKLTAGKRTVYDQVMAIFNYFSQDNGFTYSLETESGTSGSAIVDFLTNKAGFCEQYAAAMAWLVRTAKIPARVAFGFTRGTQTDGDDDVLTTRNLHAWTEVYFDGFGWVPFDATPSTSVPGSTAPVWARGPDAPQQSTNPNIPVGPGATAAPGTTDPQDPSRRDPDQGLAPGGSAIEPSATNWVWWTLGLAVLALALLALPALRRTVLRRRRQTARAPRPAGATVAPDPVTADPHSGSGERQIVVVGDAAAAARADAHAAWAELLDTMVDFRITVDPTETPRATAERLVGAERLADGGPTGRDAKTGPTGRDAKTAGGPTAADGVRLLGRAEERARYARDPLSSEHLVPSLRTVRRAFARNAGRRTRIMAVLLPPSVLERWRLAVVEGSSRAATVLVRWGDAVSPRRLLPRRG